jgi:hypothetical protein
MSKAKLALIAFSLRTIPQYEAENQMDVSVDSFIADPDKAKYLTVEGTITDVLSDYSMTAFRADDGEIFLNVGCQTRRLAVWRRVAAQVLKDHGLGEYDGDLPPELDDVPCEVYVDAGYGDFHVDLTKAERESILKRAIASFKEDNPSYGEGDQQARLIATLPSFFDAIEKHFAAKPKTKKVTKKKAKSKR